MEPQSHLRIELGIDASRMIQQVMIHNRSIEGQLQKGIDLALEEIGNEENFVKLIKENVVDSIKNIVTKSAMSWELQNKIKVLVEEKMSTKLNEIAEKIVNNVTASLEI